MSMHRRALGIAGEALAAEWYEARGFDVVARNWRCRSGEIDLVATRRGLLVVCEVKTRTTDRYGTAAEAVDWRKQRTIRAVTAQFLSRASSEGSLRRAPRQIRFDVAAVMVRDGRSTIDVIEAAF